MTADRSDSSSMKYTIALVQMSMSEDAQENLHRASDRIVESAARGARLICLPELFRTRYFCQSEEIDAFDLAEPVPGPTTEALGAVAREAKVTVIAPLFERRAPGLYHNSVALLGPRGELAGLYRKMHIPDDPGYHEKFYFAPGDLGFRAFDTEVGKVAPLICWDQWYPEAARLAALGGAETIVFPSAIGSEPGEPRTDKDRQLDAWRTIQRSHAIANGVYVAAVNRVGHEESPGADRSIDFWGSSFVCDPMGVVVAEASAEKEEILMCEVDPARIERTRREWPFLRDRRPEAYRGLDRRYLDVPPRGARS